MSSRVLRKLQGDKDFPNKLVDEKNSDLDSDLENNGAKKKKPLNVNRFNLLTQQSHSESEVKDDDDHETEVSLDVREPMEEGHDASRRKKKKKRRKKVETKASRRSSEDNMEADDIYDLPLDPEMPESSQLPSMESASSINELLQVTRKSLNPNTELKKKFGSRIVEGERSKRRGRGYVKSSWLVSPRDNWPPATKIGISMKYIETKPPDNVFFSFVHSPVYQQVEHKFLDAVETFNPDNVVAVINSHPYHVDALIQLSDMCKLSEDLQMAAELNERALYCLECAFHANFNLARGNCRLDYKQQENRPFFITLFKHMMFVGQRSCYRTSLELCKLILSLDPEGDPMGVLLCLDFYALRSAKYSWFISLFDLWESTRNLSQLPNFAFSVAMAYFLLAQERGGDSDLTSSADHYLQEALVYFPGALMPLLEKCLVQVDPIISGHPFFTTMAMKDVRMSLQQLIQLYVHRNYHLWKDQTLLDWLVANALQVVTRFQIQDPVFNEAQANRAKRYIELPRNLVRHFLLSDIKEVPGALPIDSQGAGMSFDPLPPLQSIDLYTRVERRSRAHDNSSVLSMFFRSALPNFNMNAPARNAGALDELRLMFSSERERESLQDLEEDRDILYSTIFGGIVMKGESVACQGMLRKLREMKQRGQWPWTSEVASHP
uniref:Transcription factor 25 n=1 Tax=Timema douglasi TaxID=61478 RepID=A0A7R8VFZ9_TIMDO|nr:unnamed protein product [Timema douglasi]